MVITTILYSFTTPLPISPHYKVWSLNKNPFSSLVILITCSLSSTIFFYTSFNVKCGLHIFLWGKKVAIFTHIYFLWMTWWIEGSITLLQVQVNSLLDWMDDDDIFFCGKNVYIYFFCGKCWEKNWWCWWWCYDDVDDGRW